MHQSVRIGHFDFMSHRFGLIAFSDNLPSADGRRYHGPPQFRREDKTLLTMPQKGGHQKRKYRPLFHALIISVRCGCLKPSTWAMFCVRVWGTNAHSNFDYCFYYRVTGDGL
jgi:hypothetical protein